MDERIIQTNGFRICKQILNIINFVRYDQGASQSPKNTFWFIHIRIVHIFIVYRKINPEYCTQSIFNCGHIYCEHIYCAQIYLLNISSSLCTNCCAQIHLIRLIVHNLLCTNLSINIYILSVVHNLLCTNLSIKYPYRCAQFIVHKSIY